MVMFKDAEDGEAQDITKMEQDAFNLFLDTFGETISGFKEFSDYNKQISLFSETCTVSDEAIVLFFLKKTGITGQITLVKCHKLIKMLLN